MKSFALVLIAAFASTALAEAQVFKGAGEKRAQGGSTEAYTVQSTFEEAGQGSMKETTVYTNDQGSMQIVLIRKDLGDDFYEVQDSSQNVIGSGYCVGHAQPEHHQQQGDHKVCHCEYTLDGTDVEETAMFQGGKIYRMGSLKYQNQKWVFNDKLTLEQ